MINIKSQGSITKHLRCDVLLYYTFIIQFAGERILKIGEKFGKVTDKMVNCFMRRIVFFLKDAELAT